MLRGRTKQKVQMPTLLGYHWWIQLGVIWSGGLSSTSLVIRCVDGNAFTTLTLFSRTLLKCSESNISANSLQTKTNKLTKHIEYKILSRMNANKRTNLSNINKEIKHISASSPIVQLLHKWANRSPNLEIEKNST